MIVANGQTFSATVIHTPSQRIKGQNRPTVTITTAELSVAEALELFVDGTAWGIPNGDGTVNDWSSYDVAGSVSDNRDGTISIVMGKLLEADLLEQLDVQVNTRADMTAFSDNVVKVRETLADDVASLVISLYPTMLYDGKLISAGTRIRWYGILKRASVDLWDTEANNPDNAPTLWEDILFKDGIRIIPETITAGTAFSMNEQGYWKDVLYESVIDNNVWTPESYEVAWKVVEE